MAESRGFDKDDGQVFRVLCEFAEDRPMPSLFVRGPDLLDPGDAKKGWNGDAVRVAHRSGEVDGPAGLLTVMSMYRRPVEKMKPAGPGRPGRRSDWSETR